LNYLERREISNKLKTFRNRTGWSDKDMVRVYSWLLMRKVSAERVSEIERGLKGTGEDLKKIGDQWKS
jgi:hypothetical protein